MSRSFDIVPGSSFSFADHFLTVECPGLRSPGDLLRLHYIDEGPPSGRTLLFLHGNPTWSYLYRNILPDCAARGYRVLALDNMGFGLSDKPAAVAAHTARRHIDNTQAFITALGLRKIVIVGHAWGAFFGLTYAASHPANVAGLVLLNGDTFATVDTPLAFKFLIAPGFGELIGRRLNLLAAMLLYFGTGRRKHLTPVVMSQYGRPFPDYASRAGVLGLPRMIPGRPDHPTLPLARSLEAKLHALTMPVLLIAGAHDRLIGVPAMRRLQAHLPHAETKIFAQAAHYLQEDMPEAVAQAILSFLSKHAL